MTQILIVDDEPAIRRLLSAILTRGGHEAVIAGDARAAMTALERGGIDAMLLDLGLPDRDGIELIADIRRHHSVPIVIVSARGDTAEKIAALDMGADDYVTKPFDSDELLARLRSALRRTGRPVSVDEPLTFAELSVDVARHVVTCRGAPVTLSRREFSVLQALVEANGRILTHATLLERVWGKAHVDDVDYLRVVVRALRLKLELDPATPALIRNEPGIGYRLIA